MSTYSPIRARFVLACAAVLAASLSARAKAEEFSRSFNVTGHASVQVQAGSASVRVTASDLNQVQFDVRYKGEYRWGFFAEAPPRVVARQFGNLVELTATQEQYPWWHWAWYGFRGLEIEVRMPQNADLQVVTSNGSVAARSVSGHVAIHTSNGSIYAEGLSGTMDFTSSNGAVTLDSLKGSTSVHTSNGFIRAINLDGGCELATSNGGIHVEGRFDSLDISTGNGGVVAKAQPGSRMSSGWSIRTSNAHVALFLPTDLKANLDAATTNGSISLSLPVLLQGYATPREIHGSLNGGGPEMLIRTTNAGIEVGAI